MFTVIWLLQKFLLESSKVKVFFFFFPWEKEEAKLVTPPPPNVSFFFFFFSHFGETSDYGRYCHDMNDERQIHADWDDLGKKGRSSPGFC